MGFTKKEPTPGEPITGKEVEMPPPPVTPPGAPSIPEVVDRLEELVKFALECEGKELREGVSFVEVFKQLEEVRHAIEFLNQDQKELLALFSSATGGKVDITKTALSDEDKKIVDKLRHLQTVCEAAKQRMYTTIKKTPEGEAEAQEKIEAAKASETRKKTRRKEKFRPLGGKEGWVRT